MAVTRAPHDSGSRAALRAVIQARPEARAVEYPTFVTEQPGAADPPVLSAPHLLEKRAEAVNVGTPEPGFAAFLDGTQSARIVTWLDNVPYVLGRAAAVVRARRERQLQTWDGAGPLLMESFYLPLAYTAADIPGWRVIDTTAANLGARPSRHPAALLERALGCLQRDREMLERQLLESWVSHDAGVICADGPLPSAGAARSSPDVVGVIKNHRTIYGEGPSLDLVLSLVEGARSPAFEVRTGSRDSVLSWYLRVRDNTGHDATWGLVRVESVMVSDVTARADEVSRWIMAERSPVALPDPRWDRMSYGVQNCEAFLRAVS